MAITVKLTENLVAQAKTRALIRHRSVPKQIYYWSQIGKIAEENPDLPLSMIRGILIADQETGGGEYVFS
jgi:ParD-like antitoxin of type II bacterial toxin-antitoxin system